ncbi:Periplasmic chaperone PpiD [Buchnera aphidicola (Tetraneura ulmi)]|uniref:SurA N-terminal domain-containing protein n=1 Tax=Buchnera aphidicola TaxID=9 RepID=UPI0034644505
MNYSKKKIKTIFLNTILFIIIISIFLSSFLNYYNKNYRSYALKINGETITVEKFLNKFNLYKKEIEKKNKEISFYEKNDQSIRLEIFNQILSKIINDALLEQYTKKIGFSVSDFIVQKKIINKPYFKKEGKFNYNLYLSKLYQHHITPKQYEKKIKNKIATNTFINTFINTNFSLKKETDFISKLISEKRFIKILNINNFSLFEKEKVKKNEIKNFFKKNKKLFISPKKIKISYIKIQKNKIPIKIKNKEIKHWYKQHLSQFYTNEFKKFSIIQSDNKKKLKKILSILLLKNSNFKKLAKKYSSDPISSKKYGELGWFNSNELPISIKKAKLIKKGQISKIIKINSKIYIIIKLDDIKIKKIKKINEIKNNIIKKIKFYKQSEIYENLKKTIENKNKKFLFQSIKTISKNINIKKNKTKWITKNNIPKELSNKKIIGLLSDPKIEKEKQKTSFIKINENLMYLIQFKKIKKEKLIQFEKVKNKIYLILKNKKSRKKSKKIGLNIIKNLTKNENFLSNNNKYKFKKHIILSRDINNSLSRTVFQLPYPKKNKKIYILKKNEIGNLNIICFYKVFNKKLNPSEKKIISNYFKQYKSEIILATILKNLQKNSNIKYGKIFL